MVFLLRVLPHGLRVPLRSYSTFRTRASAFPCHRCNSEEPKSLSPFYWVLTSGCRTFRLLLRMMQHFSVRLLSGMGAALFGSVAVCLSVCLSVCGEERRGEERKRRGEERRGEERRGEERRGQEKTGEDRRGEERRGEKGRSVCRPVCLSVCRSVCRSVCLSVHLSVSSVSVTRVTGNVFFIYFFLEVTRVTRVTISFVRNIFGFQKERGVNRVIKGEWLMRDN